MPRPIERFNDLPAYKELNVPVIGTFGFGTLGKGFEDVVAAVNREFDEAIIKLNIPFGTFTHSLDSVKQSNGLTTIEQIKLECEKLKKPGIDIRITHDFFNERQLVEWCSQNTLNCFFYSRNMPGLSAATDQAISSGRPLAVTENPTFRHVLQYITPYPRRILEQSIVVSTKEVMAMRDAWSPENFLNKFEIILKRLNVLTD